MRLQSRNSRLRRIDLRSELPNTPANRPKKQTVNQSMPPSPATVAEAVGGSDGDRGSAWHCCLVPKGQPCSQPRQHTNPGPSSERHSEATTHPPTLRLAAGQAQPNVHHRPLHGGVIVFFPQRGADVGDDVGDAAVGQGLLGACWEGR